MAISADQQTSMKNTASGGTLPFDYQSLGEYLQGQLTRAQGKQQAFDQYQPTAQKNAEAIGSFEGRAPGESPVDIRAQGLTTAQAISKTASSTSGDIIGIITQMMNLKKQQQTAEQEARDSSIELSKTEKELNSTGLTIYDEAGNLLDQPRRMTDSEIKSLGTSMYAGLTDEEAVSQAINKFGTSVWLGKTVGERGARARDLLASSATGQSPELNQLFSKVDVTTVKALSQLRNIWQGGEGTTDDLSQGFLGGGKLSGEAFISYLFNKPSNLNVYNKTKKGLIATLKTITGDTGVLTDTDAERIENLLPTATTSNQDAIAQWEQINGILQETLGINFDDPRLYGSQSGDYQETYNRDDVFKEAGI